MSTIPKVNESTVTAVLDCFLVILASRNQKHLYKNILNAMNELKWQVARRICCQSEELGSCEDS